MIALATRMSSECQQRVRSCATTELSNCHPLARDISFSEFWQMEPADLSTPELEQEGAIVVLPTGYE